MKQIVKRICFLSLLILFLTALPLIGVWIAGDSVKQYLEFPPLTRYVEHAGFSWPVFIGLALVILTAVCPFIIRILTSPFPRVPASPRHRFPSWGWAGVALNIAAWFLSWKQPQWLGSLQLYIFFPIWLGYIIVVNAYTHKRTGKCMLINQSSYFVMLFIASSAFWWFFEYLNRFVQNWYYTGIETVTPLQYFIIGSLHFSTVLPAVLGTYDLLKSFPRISSGMDKFIRIDKFSPKTTAWLTLTASCAGLTAIGIWPDYLFPLLWLSPLFIITSLQTIYGRNTIFSSIRYGYWRRIFLLALSALICGFFWEMWNFHSSPQWIYTVPFVARFKVFEMPILGYAGYLPFGLECAIIADMIKNTLKLRIDSNELD
ncbi:hypothetical protein ACFLS1_11875 [Verrucomicrobiota bacterium]